MSSSFFKREQKELNAIESSNTNKYDPESPTSKKIYDNRPFFRRQISLLMTVCQDKASPVPV